MINGKIVGALAGAIIDEVGILNVDAHITRFQPSQEFPVRWKIQFSWGAGIDFRSFLISLDPDMLEALGQEHLVKMFGNQLRQLITSERLGGLAKLN